MQLFSADATMFSKFFFFLPTKSWKNLPQKLLIIGPNLLFHSPAQPTANSPKSIFHIIKMSRHASVLLSVMHTSLSPQQKTLSRNPCKTLLCAQLLVRYTVASTYHNFYFPMNEMAHNNETFFDQWTESIVIGLPLELKSIKTRLQFKRSQYGLRTFVKIHFWLIDSLYIYVRSPT